MANFWSWKSDWSPSFPMSYCRSKVLCYHFIIFDSLCWSFLGPRLGKFELKFLHGSITRGSPEKGKQSWKRLISAYIRITCWIINPSLLELLDILYLGFINEFNLDYGHGFQAATRQKRSPIRKFSTSPHYHVQMKVRQLAHLARASLRVA